MKTKLKSLIVALSALALCGAPAFAAGKQPEMNAAIEQLEHARKAHHPIEQLEQARKAHHPIEQLEQAKHELEEARHNKGGERVEAIKQVNEAIEAAHHHNHKAMHEHIEAAIREVRESKHAASR